MLGYHHIGTATSGFLHEGWHAAAAASSGEQATVVGGGGTPGKVSSGSLSSHSQQFTNSSDQSEQNIFVICEQDLSCREGKTYCTK